jgi:hypothetical protein
VLGGQIVGCGVAALRNPRLQLQEKLRFHAARASESLCKGKTIIISNPISRKEQQ